MIYIFTVPQEQMDEVVRISTPFMSSPEGFRSTFQPCYWPGTDRLAFRFALGGDVLRDMMRGALEKSGFIQDQDFIWDAMVY